MTSAKFSLDLPKVAGWGCIYLVPPRLPAGEAGLREAGAGGRVRRRWRVGRGEAERKANGRNGTRMSAPHTRINVGRGKRMQGKRANVRHIAVNAVRRVSACASSIGQESD